MLCLGIMCILYVAMGSCDCWFEHVIKYCVANQLKPWQLSCSVFHLLPFSNVYRAACFDKVNLAVDNSTQL